MQTTLKQQAAAIKRAMSVRDAKTVNEDKKALNDAYSTIIAVKLNEVLKRVS